MRAIEVTEYGGPDVLAVVDREPSRPGPGEVTVDVEATGINFADIEKRRGNYPDAPAPPYVPGGEAAGTVAAVGPGVDEYSVGDQVTVFALDDEGTYAESVTTSTRNLIDFADDLDPLEAAAVPVNYLTAHNALHEWGGLREGERVLVHAAAGGVGTAAVQLADVAGAEVYGTASSREKLEFAGSLGMDHGIDYTDEDLAEVVESLTDGEGVDLVLDGVGGDAFTRSVEALAEGGRIVVYGMASGDIPTVATPRILFDNQSVVGYHLIRAMNDDDLRERVRSAIPELNDHFEAGRVEVTVGETFDLEAAREAHRFIEDRRSRGKVVLTTDRSTGA